MSLQSILNLAPVFTPIEGNESFASSELDVKSAVRTAPRLAAPPRQKENISSETNLTMAKSLPTEALKPTSFVPASLFKSPLQSSRGAFSTVGSLAPASTSTVQSSTATTSAYNTLGTAYNWGTLFSSTTPNGVTINRSISGQSVSSNNLKDYYRFAIEKTANLDVSLSNLAGNADLRLIRDANNNGIIDAGDVILGGYNPSNMSESFRAEGLGRGSYFLEVGSVNGTFTNYTLGFSATTGIPREPAGFSGNTLARAIPIAGQLNGERVFQGSVNANGDINDYYRFTLDQAVRFTGNLTPLDSNANMYLYQDANQNGTIEPGELIGYSANPGTSNDIINKEILSAGDYYVQVQKPANTGSTDYMLQLYGTPITKNSRVTVDIHHLKALEQFDRKVSWTNWHQADFHGVVWIDGKSHDFGTFQDQDVVTGLKFTQEVDPNKRFINIDIYAFDDDGIFGGFDYADLSPNRSRDSIRLRYDTVKQQVIPQLDSFFGVRSEGDRITLSGNLNHPNDGLYNTYAAEISFSVNYDPIL
ncbi:PPC domain-containing protein [Nodosilinea sp. PGN35]|uniref:PPC domain-containing protein n=1 Tax=Nodosilinea sp. PGN35 TaxID=3020489 RepID=UPI0023B20DA5|nr:PPC domain-containing protein [Nodosilinea sp. TSF1-S3]MDF0370064.1 PPC domain-containing protein [Nodosilinea sp. TSF1-S3]